LEKLEVAQSEKYGMGTVIANKVFGEQAEEALQAALKEIGRLEGILSRFARGSEISRINRAAGIRCEKVGRETYDVLSQAIYFSECCHGCFDVTIGPLVCLWADARKSSEPPDEADIERLLPLVDHNSLVMNPDRVTVGLKRADQSIDLGGVGKGYAADKVLDVFRSFGISSAFTNFGGNVAAMGAKPDGSPWHIGIRHPRKENSLIGAISVVDRSVVTSGDYQRYFIGKDGKRYHHILAPNTGYPAESGLISATVVAGSSAAADALSTAIFVAGMQQGVGFLGAFPGAEAIFVGHDLSVYATKGLQGSFQADNGISINWIL